MRGRICGTGSYIPEHYYDNNDLAKFVETNDEWIRERTGIVRRHIAEEGEIFPAVTHSDGAKGQVLACESRQQKNWQDKENEKQTYVSMDGQAVFKFAVKKVPEVIGELLQKADLTEKDIDLFVLHQANLRIIESVAKRMKTDLAKFPVNIEEYGNTSSASIPILLDELNKTGRFHKGQKIVLCGFGAGLTWGATLIEW